MAASSPNPQICLSIFIYHISIILLTLSAQFFVPSAHQHF